MLAIGLQIVVEQRELWSAVDEIRVGLAGMIQIMDNSCQQRRNLVHIGEYTLHRFTQYLQWHLTYNVATALEPNENWTKLSTLQHHEGLQADTDSKS